jgi:formylglycine-generating enzyme required for sulfatase activity
MNDGIMATAPVGSFQPNLFGFHDMAGNVLEWCKDRYGDYENGVNPGDGLRKIREDDWNNRFYMWRGGDYRSSAFYARSAMRSGRLPGYQLEQLGLRPSMAVHRKAP